MSTPVSDHSVSNPVLDLIAAHGPDEIFDRLSLAGRRALGTSHAHLVADQDRRLAADEPVQQLPLAWLALAAAVGLEVDDAGRIVGGPRQRFRTWRAADLDIE